jgi:UDP-N-acetylmuramate dehydrogenase
MASKHESPGTGGAVVPAPHGLQREFPLARLATVRTGGPAEFFLRVGAAEGLAQALAWARSRRLDVAVLGSGSNVLIADEGVRGLVIKPDRSLAAIEVDGSRVICGAAARLPSVAARAAREGLGGIEFGVNIPGTVGGAVRMNAGAYGGELAQVLERVLIASADGLQQRARGQLGFAYRTSSLTSDEIVAEATFALTPTDPEMVRARLAQMRKSRHEAQPRAIQTFGSTFKNPSPAPSGAPSAGQLLSQAGCNGLRVGGARFAPKHANFVENLGTATTADILELMAEGRRRVQERFGVSLEPEVQVLGEVRFPW